MHRETKCKKILKIRFFAWNILPVESVSDTKPSFEVWKRFNRTLPSRSCKAERTNS